MRDVFCFVVLFVFLSCGEVTGYSSGSADDGKIRYCAYGNPLFHTRRKLLEFAIQKDALRKGESFFIGPVELIGNSASVECGYEPHTPYSQYIHAFEETGNAQPYEPLYVLVDNMHSDSLMLLVNYSYILESDTSYEVTDGTLYIPLEGVGNTSLSGVVDKGLPLKHIFAKGKQRIILDVDNLIL